MFKLIGKAIRACFVYIFVVLSANTGILLGLGGFRYLTKTCNKVPQTLERGSEGVEEFKAVMESVAKQNRKNKGIPIPDNLSTESIVKVFGTPVIFGVEIIGFLIAVLMLFGASVLLPCSIWLIMEYHNIGRLRAAGHWIVIMLTTVLTIVAILLFTDEVSWHELCGAIRGLPREINSIALPDWNMPQAIAFIAGLVLSLSLWEFFLCFLIADRIKGYFAGDEADEQEKQARVRIGPQTSEDQFWP